MGSSSCAVMSKRSFVDGVVDGENDEADVVGEVDGFLLGLLEDGASKTVADGGEDSMTVGRLDIDEDGTSGAAEVCVKDGTSDNGSIIVEGVIDTIEEGALLGRKDGTSDPNVSSVGVKD